MADYTLAVGTHDPCGFAAESDLDAIRQAIRLIESQHADDLSRNPQEVVTLLGPGDLITRPSERLDEFVRRLPGASVVDDTGRFQPGDANTPDCNGE